MKVKLVASGGKTRSHRLRHRPRACAPIRRSAAGSTAATIDETPILGRKVDDAAAAQLGVPAGQGHRRPLRQRDLLHHRRRAAAARRRSCSTARATTRAGAARRCSPPCRSARSRKSSVLSNAFSAEFGWTAGPGAEHRHQVRHQRAARRRRSTWASRRLAGEDVLDRRLLPAVGVRRCVDADHADRDQPGGHAGRAEPGLRLDRRADRQGQDVLLRHRRLHAAGSDDVPLDHAAGVRAAGGRQPRPTSGNYRQALVQRAASITSSRRRRR